TDESGLSEYLAYAALNNPGLEAAFNRWKAQLEQVPQVQALPDPRFTYRYYIREVETRVGAQRQAFGISQTFPWYEKLQLAGYAAVEAADAERKTYEAEKLRLFHRVKEAYYEYYYLGRAVAIVEENIRLLQNIEAVLRTRYRASAASHPEVIRAQVELGKLDDRLRTLQDLQSPIVAKLNAAMNRPANASLPWPQDVEDHVVVIDEAELLVWLQHSSPEVEAMNFVIAQRDHEIELAKQAYIPDVTLGLDYIDTASSTGGRHPSDDGQDALIAGVSINLPIWFAKLSAGVREARHRRLAAVHERAEFVNRLTAEFQLVAYQFRDADRRIDLYGDTLIPKVEESLKATMTAFQAGDASFTDLIDAQRLLLEFQLAYERGLSDKLQRLAELEMLTGQEISETGNVVADPIVPNDEATDETVAGDLEETVHAPDTVPS
ncbi:MAG: TolC family protein, partial [Planctomycetota bacterium]